MIELRSRAEIEQMRPAGAFVAEVLTAMIEAAKSGINLLEIDELGLDRTTKHLLSLIIDKFGGGPVGLETLSAALSEEKDTIEDVYEPFLLQSGLLMKTPRGRVATELCYRHLGRMLPDGMRQLSLLD